jgi:hypothetical protein
MFAELKRAFVCLLLSAIAMPAPALASRFLSAKQAAARIRRDLPENRISGEYGEVEWTGPRLGVFRRFRVPYGQKGRLSYYRSGEVNLLKRLSPAALPVHHDHF